MKDFRKQIEKGAQERFQHLIDKNPDYVVQQLHRDDDTVKLWRCGRPQSSTYMTYICSSPNCLMMYGDMGECMWQRHYDMIPFIRGSVESLDYFSEKVPTDLRDSIKTDHRELIEEWFATVKDEYISQGREWGKEEDKALEEVRSAYANYECVHDLQTAVAESVLYHDVDDIPNFKYYDFCYLWKIEALKWFIKKLDAGEILPYREPADAK